MGQKPPRISLILTAVLFALSCFGFTLFVWKSFGGNVPFEPKGYRFHVPFGTEATQLTPNAEVRVSGVRIGRVVVVRQLQGGTDATLEIEPRYAPVSSDARAIIRYKTLLGESFVEMSLGSKNAPKVAENGSLDRRNVGAVQQLDQVLASFDKPTREALKTFLKDISAALKDRGPDINDALGNAAPATENLADVTEILDRQRDALRGLVRDGGAALRAVGARDADLVRLIEAGDTVFRATAERNRDLTETLRALPPFLGELRATLSEVEGVSADAAPVLSALRSAAPSLTPALEESARLAPELKRVFVALSPTIAAARTGLPALTRVVNAARPLLATLYPAGRELVPVVQYLGLYKNEIVSAMANLGASTQATGQTADGVTRHYLRALIPLTNEGFVGAQHREPTNRHNPYLPPGGMSKLASGRGVPAWHCRNVSNSSTYPGSLGAPPCEEQKPFDVLGQTRSFPHLEQDGP